MAPPKKVKATSAPTDGADLLAKDVLDGILKEMGDAEGAQMLGSDGLAIKIRGVISTQCVAIDAATGRGGIPLGRLTILHGAEGSGKTTLALHIVAEVQRLGGVAVYIDKEYKIDPEYAAKLGVNTNNLILSQPKYLEQVFKVCQGAIRRAAQARERVGHRVPILVVLDSMNAAITKAQFEGDWDDKHMAAQARVYSSLLPKLMPEVSKEDVALLWISQVRKKMNVMYGNDEEIAGGNAPRFYASMIMKVTRIGSTKEGEEKVANKTRVECVKNQIAPPFRKGECEIVYGVGIDGVKALVSHGEAVGIIKREGAYYSHNGERLGQGLEGSTKALRGKPDWAGKILAEIREAGKW